MSTKPDALESLAGEEMPDGSIYAGISPDTGRPIFVAAADELLEMNSRMTNEYALHKRTHSHQDWRIPSIGELRLMFNSRAKIGGFNHESLYLSSSSRGEFLAESLDFADGRHRLYDKSFYAKVRFVRG